MSENQQLKQQLKGLLGKGLVTEIEPRAYSHEEILDIVSRLQILDETDYEDKLVVAGFTLTPYGDEEDEQACETCMYYKTHQKFCELPELMVPVDPEWSCRLWRI